MDNVAVMNMTNKGTGEFALPERADTSYYKLNALRTSSFTQVSKPLLVTF